MAITGVNSYNSVYENIYASSKKEEVKKEETKETAYTQKSIEFLILQLYNSFMRLFNNN